MNAGIIASRYARALLKFVQEDGSGKEVYSQARTLVHMMNELEQMRQYVTDVLDVSLDSKLSLLSAAVNGSLHPCLVRFLTMVSEHRRVEYFPRMLLSFIEQYRKENNIQVGRLVTASHQEGLCGRLEGIFHRTQIKSQIFRRRQRHAGRGNALHRRVVGKV